MSTFKRIITENHYKKNTIQRKLIFRSNWEIAFANFIDNNNNVASWTSEFRMKYLDKFNNPPKIRTYLVDFYIEMLDKSKILCEVKPISSLQLRVVTKSMRYKRIHTVNYLKNLAKFDTVQLFCQKSGWKFFLVQKKSNHFEFYCWDIKTKSPILVR